MSLIGKFSLNNSSNARKNLMRIAELKILVAGTLLFITASAQGLQPEVLYAFQLEPRNPSSRLVQGNDGNLYGTTAKGGSRDAGTVFKVTPDGALSELVSFNGTNGGWPSGGLLLGPDGNFYGTTRYGGSGDCYDSSGSGCGTVFKVTASGVLIPLVSFSSTFANPSFPSPTNAVGSYPVAGLVLGNDGNFYGTTAAGGTSGNGTVFRISTNGVLTSLASFAFDKGQSPGQLALGNDGNFYGTTSAGGSHNRGTVFKVTPNGVLTRLVSFRFFDVNGSTPFAGLVLGRDGNFYGTTVRGGGGDCHGDFDSGCGTVFRVTPAGVLTTLASFNRPDGISPAGGLVLSRDGDFYGTTGSGGSSDRGTVFRVTTNGLLTSLASFNIANGEYPDTELLLGRDGNFYGTTPRGGANESGTVFKVTTNGLLTTVFSLNNANAGPNAGLVLGGDGHFYGTTYGGGSSGNGTVFKVTTNGVLNSLISFNGTNGAYRSAGLLLGNDGNFYGTTQTGGSSYVDGNNPGYGTIFHVAQNGELTWLVSFNGANGAHPQGGLALGDDGHFYGTTWEGGSSGKGTVFRMTANGALTSLVSFNSTNNAHPTAGLVLGNDDNFYGTTYGHTKFSDYGAVFKVSTNGVLTTLVSFSGVGSCRGLVLGIDGNFYGTTSGSEQFRSESTMFKVTTAGVLTTLVTFTGNHGLGPSKLVLGRDGNFYGTTFQGGSSGNGTVFKVTTNGLLTTLASFNGTNGTGPNELVIGRDGYFYGTTSAGGAGGGGTIFRLVISAFNSVARQPGGSVLLTGAGPTNGAYRLWASTDLSLPLASWTHLTSASFDSNGNFSYADTGAATNPSRFYQLSAP